MVIGDVTIIFDLRKRGILNYAYLENVGGRDINIVLLVHERPRADAAT